MMKELAKSLLPFLSVSFVFLLTGLILVIITEKELLHLSANGFVGGVADQFFAYYTHIGDGIVVPFVILSTCLIKRKEFWANFSLGITSFALTGLLAQFFKRIIFSDQFRPGKIFHTSQLRLVEGVDLHQGFSFPSGHSTASFSLFIFIAFVFRKYRWVQIIAAILAILACYSRVHISQHFIEDILAGAFLGIAGFFLFYYLFKRFIFKENWSI